MLSVSLIITLVCTASAFYSPLHTEYEWKYFDYLWDSPAQREQYIRNGLYDYRNLTPIDVDRSVDGRTFVTIIRGPGVPASVHTVTTRRGPSGPLLKPYPNWFWYENNRNCQGIVSAFRVAIDECNRIWVLDSGVMGEDRICPAKLVVFNLYNDKLLFQKVIPNDIAQSKTLSSLLITPIIETYGQNCERTMVYIGDVTGHALIVWNAHGMYRLEADVYEPEQRYSTIEVANQSFFLDDGILGMALSSAQNPGQSRFLSFRPLASLSLYAVNTRALQHDVDARNIQYYRGNGVLPSQGSAMVFSNDGTLFYGLTKEIAIGCWNKNNPLEPEYFDIAISDNERLQFTSGMKIVYNSPFSRISKERLLVMTNRMQKLYTNTYNFNEINYRIMSASVAELQIGTKCWY